MNFDEEKDEILIEMVAKHPCLYDLKSAAYKNQRIKDNAWKEIGHILERDADECKKRWKNIKDTYRRRKQKGKCTGAAASSKGKKWPLMDILTFLDDTEYKRKDALSHHATRHLKEERQLEMIQNVTDLLRKTFSSQFVFPALGHDDPSARRELGRMWAQWLPTDAMKKFEMGGYYIIERKTFKLQIVVLNTNLMKREDNDEEAKKQWDWLEEVLQKFEKIGQRARVDKVNIDGLGRTKDDIVEDCIRELFKAKDFQDVLLKAHKVYLLGHIPPGSDERHKGLSAPNHIMYRDFHNKKYLNMVRKYNEIIAGQFFGHLHSDTFRVIYDEKGQPISWAMLAPSITPKRTHDGPNNPGLRLYKFDKDIGQVFDYTQYYLDLSAANYNGKADWVVEYNFSTYYGINDITPLNLHILADKFTQETTGDNSVFNKYYRANSVKIHNRAPTTSDDTCAHSHYCAITRIDYMEHNQCLKVAASALASSSSFLPFLAKFKLICVGLIGLVRNTIVMKLFD